MIRVWVRPHSSSDLVRTRFGYLCVRSEFNSQGDYTNVHMCRQLLAQNNFTDDSWAHVHKVRYGGQGNGPDDTRSCREVSHQSAILIVLAKVRWARPRCHCQTSCSGGCSLLIPSECHYHTCAFTHTHTLIVTYTSLRNDTRLSPPYVPDLRTIDTAPRIPWTKPVPLLSPEAILKSPNTAPIHVSPLL